MQTVSMAFFANKSFLSNKHVSLALKLGYFDSVVSAVACFAAAHRKFYKRGLQCMDVICRKLFRSVVGAPAGMSTCENRWRFIVAL